MDIVKIGVIGLGNMGSAHAQTLFSGVVNGALLVAVCDIDEQKLADFSTAHNNIATYTDYEKMILSGKIDAIIIAVPHYLHPQIAIFGFEHNMCVLTEKPAGVYTKQVRAMNEAAKVSKKPFCIMFNQRTNELYAKAREIVKNGELGERKRLTWTITNWYRTQFYYDSGSWRGSWRGEGGGVLINQAPHNLDLWQWIFGMPKTVYAHVYEGKYHNIDVEDEANIYAEYDDGATAQFMTSTGEYPGTNRLEISGSLGKIVLENGRLTKYMLEQNERDLCFTAQNGFISPPVKTTEIMQENVETAHLGILQNFVNHILYGEQLLSPGAEGINELTISNAAYLSAWKNEPITLPLNEDEYYEWLQKKIQSEKLREKNVVKDSINHGKYNERWSVRW